MTFPLGWEAQLPTWSTWSTFFSAHPTVLTWETQLWSFTIYDFIIYFSLPIPDFLELCLAFLVDISNLKNEIPWFRTSFFSPIFADPYRNKTLDDKQYYISTLSMPVRHKKHMFFIHLKHMFFVPPEKIEVGKISSPNNVLCRVSAVRSC